MNSLIRGANQVAPKETIVVTFRAPFGRSLLSVSWASTMASLPKTSWAVR